VINQVFGVSFSTKQCRNFQLDPAETLDWLINEAGFRRFRLMSYWNEHEKQPGKFDFKELDRQIDAIEKAGGVVTLCLGARQPRWPENHWPEWAWQLTPAERTDKLLAYIETIVNRYRANSCVISYQLENEALLKAFGERPEVDRKRLQAEFQLVKRLDPTKPVIMTTSTSWGIPVRRPIPDQVGFSYYHTLYRMGDYHHSLFYPWIHRLRKNLIYLIHYKPSFIHELQLEPWGPTAIWKMSNNEQAKSMSTEHIARNIKLARQIKAPPIDLWGGEWWYWRLKQGDPSIWQAVQKNLR
jgi:hypothetical protein